MNADELPAAVWRELTAACADREHGWRTPVLATVDADGLPQARTVVLRKADVAHQALSCFTDHRSPKVAQLRAQPVVQLLFWSAARQWQLRVRARMTIVTSGPEVDAAWGRISMSSAAADYISLRPPGALLQSIPLAAQGGHHLAVLVATVEDMDWLALAPAGHQRFRLGPEGVTPLQP